MEHRFLEKEDDGVDYATVEKNNCQLTTMSREEVLKALENWIIRIAKKENATPEEIAALPEVAEVYLSYFSG